MYYLAAHHEATDPEEQRRFLDQATQLEQELESLERRFGWGDAYIEVRRGNFQQAIEKNRRTFAVVIRENERRGCAGTLRSLDEKLVRALLERRRVDDAEQLLQTRVNEYKLTFPPTHAVHAHIGTLYGKVLRLQRKYAEAEAQLKAAFDRLDPDSLTPPIRRLQVASELALLFEDWNKPEQTAEWRRKSSDIFLSPELKSARSAADELLEKGRSPTPTKRRDDSAQAERYLKRAIEAYERIFDGAGAARAYSEVGIEYGHQWRYQDCFDAHAQVRRWCERIVEKSERENKNLNYVPGEVEQSEVMFRYELGDREQIFDSHRKAVEADRNWTGPYSRNTLLSRVYWGFHSVMLGREAGLQEKEHVEAGKQQLDQVAPLLEKQLQEDPSQQLNERYPSAGYAYLAGYYLHRGHSARTQEMLDKALQYAQDSLRADARKWSIQYFIIGAVSEDRGETDKAFDAWKEGLNIAKQNCPQQAWCVADLQFAYRSLIEAYKRYNRLDEAEAVAIDVTNFLDNLKELPTNHPAHAYIRYERGVIQRLRGDRPGAKQSLTDAKERLAKFELAPPARVKEIDDELHRVEVALQRP